MHVRASFKPRGERASSPQMMFFQKGDYTQGKEKKKEGIGSNTCVLPQRGGWTCFGESAPSPMDWRWSFPQMLLSSLSVTKPLWKEGKEKAKENFW